MNSFLMIILIGGLIAAGLITLSDHFFFYPARKARVMAQHPEWEGLSKKQRAELLKAPFLADYARSLFPVLCIVLFLRQFIFGLYVVPTGSMLPTIQLDDLLYVNKLAYQIHIPFRSTPIWTFNAPKRGDIIVFPYPVNPSVDYIKTVIGLPGDTISYVHKVLTVNGKVIPSQSLGTAIEITNSNLGDTTVMHTRENIGGHLHDIYTTPSCGPNTTACQEPDFYHLVVPKGEYFVMGDNRDNSEDSRYWGFVKQSTVVGKASFILASVNPNHYYLPRFDRFFRALP